MSVGMNIDHHHQHCHEKSANVGDRQDDDHGAELTWHQWRELMRDIDPLHWCSCSRFTLHSLHWVTLHFDTKTGCSENQNAVHHIALHCQY